MTAVSDGPRWTWAGVYEGARLTVPLLPGALVFAAALGTLAGQKGLSLTETVLMSALVFAGASQLVALEVWMPVWTFGALVTLALVTATVNLRFVLMTASLHPWLGGLPPWQSYPMLTFTVDATWLIAMRYRADGGSNPGVFLGSGLLLWAFWVAATIPGYLVGAMVEDPKRFGLDLVLPIFFAAMLTPMWRGWRRAVPWAVAGLAAVAIAHLVDGWWFIIGGALAGSVAGGFIHDR